MLNDSNLIHHKEEKVPAPQPSESIIMRNVSPVKTRNLESNVFSPIKEEESRPRTEQKRRRMAQC
jgi:hypothetical protein